jgi:hypothetical protein
MSPVVHAAHTLSCTPCWRFIIIIIIIIIVIIIIIITLPAQAGLWAA